MFRIIRQIIEALVLLGFLLALLNHFSWDLGALLTWVWSGGAALVESIADFFQGNAFFQKLVGG